jgi:hypothetical protein
MMAEGVVLVGYWRSLPPAEFLAWFAANEPRLVVFYGTLEVAAAVFAVAAGGWHALRRRPGRGFLLASAALAVAVLVLYPLYFRDVNASFAAPTIALDAVPAELSQWAAWQWARIAIGVGAFAAALAGVIRSEE